MQRGSALRAYCGRNSSQSIELVRYGSYFRGDRAFCEQCRRDWVWRWAGWRSVLDSWFPHLSYSRCDCDRPAWADVPRRRLDLRLDDQGLWRVYGLLWRVLRLVAWSSGNDRNRRCCGSSYPATRHTDQRIVCLARGPLGTGSCHCSGYCFFVLHLGAAFPCDAEPRQYDLHRLWWRDPADWYCWTDLRGWGTRGPCRLFRAQMGP